jgi:hypothetical protein
VRTVNPYTPGGGGTPGHFTEFHQREVERWGAVVRKAGIEPE